MSVTIKGTDTSAAAPSFTGSDGDTGLYFPAAGQAAIATNGTQAVLVDDAQSVRINGASAATADSKLNTQITSAGSLITLAEFRNLDYTAGTKSYIRVRNAINSGSSYSSYFGQGVDGRTYIVANNSGRGGDIIINGDNGAVTTPSQPMFSVTKTDGYVTGSTGSGTQIIWDNTSLCNVGGYYNSSNGYFTAPVAGTYYFSAMGMLNTSTVGNNDTQLQIQVNGTAVAISNPPMASASVQGMGFAVSCVVTLAASDSVRVTFYASPSNNRFYADGGRFNNFSGFLVG